MSNNITGKISNYNNLSGNITTNNQLSGTLSSSANLSGNIMYTILKGLSAYEVAVDNGYTGTVEEWLESLVGNGIDSVVLNEAGYLTLYFTNNTSYTTPISLKGKDGHSPYIGNNGNWYIWDDTHDRYMDSGYTSIIVIGNGLTIDAETGEISVDTESVNTQLDYAKMNNLPSIESVELKGNKTFSDLGISAIGADDLLEILQ